MTVRAGSSSAPQRGEEQRAEREGEGGAAQGERILCAAVTRRSSSPASLAAAPARGLRGRDQGPEEDTTAHRGAELFYERCSGCHTFEAANAYGSKPEGQLQGGERTNGPNFNVRKVDARRRALRDPQRRLLGRDHARQHRDRGGRRRRRAIPRQVLGHASGQPGTGRGRECSTSGRSGTTRSPRATRSRGAGSIRPCSTRRSRSTSAAARSCPSSRSLRARKNQASKRIGRASSGSGEDASEAIAEMQGVVGAREGARGRAAASVEERRSEALASLPNLPDPTAPPEDEVIREVGESGQDGAATTSSCSATTWTWSGRARVGLALRLPEGAARPARARARAVGAVDARRARLHPGHPARARARAGALRDRLAARHRAAALPRARGRRSTSSAPPRCRSPRSTRARSSPATSSRCRYAGFSPCFRREAGAAGKDTRGLFRVHQFDKVEMFSFVEPEQSRDEHERLLAIEEEILQALAIPYRVVNIAVDDLGASAAKKYDLEAWLPGQGATASSPRARTRPTSRRAGSTSATGPARARARATCTRSTARPSPSAGRSSRSSRTASATTAPSTIPEVLHPFGAPLRLEPAAALASRHARRALRARVRRALRRGVELPRRDQIEPLVTPDIVWLDPALPEPARGVDGGQGLHAPLVGRLPRPALHTRADVARPPRGLDDAGRGGWRARTRRHRPARIRRDRQAHRHRRHRRVGLRGRAHRALPRLLRHGDLARQIGVDAAARHPGRARGRPAPATQARFARR